MASDVEKSYRHLPHWHLDGSGYHVVFRSRVGELSPEARQQTVDVIRFGEGKRFRLYLGVVMPDHVHLLIQPLENSGASNALSEIVKLIKGTSAHKINQLLGTSGSIWQDESYDHIIRNEADFNKQIEYIFLNPVRAGLVTDPNDYPFLLLP